MMTKRVLLYNSNVIAALLVAFVVVAGVSVSQAQQVVNNITLDRSTWRLPAGQILPYYNSTVGGIITFDYNPSLHNVYLYEFRNCSSPGVKTFVSWNETPTSYTFLYPGQYHFACDLNNHCTYGMLTTVVVRGSAAPSMSPQPSPAPSLSAPPTRSVIPSAQPQGSRTFLPSTQQPSVQPTGTSSSTSFPAFHHHLNHQHKSSSLLLLSLWVLILAGIMV